MFAGTAEAAYNPNLPYYVPTAYTQGKVFFTKSGGSWHYNWTFVPAYDDDLANPRPYGTWSAAYLSAMSYWTGSSDYSQDFGVATMNTNFGGWHIVDYFGGQGITVNRGKSGVKIPCNMTRGSSGGGWLNGYDGNWGWLNGVNSRIDSISAPTIMLSPYFDDYAWNLYNYTRYN